MYLLCAKYLAHPEVAKTILHMRSDLLRVCQLEMVTLIPPQVSATAELLAFSSLPLLKYNILPIRIVVMSKRGYVCVSIRKHHSLRAGSLFLNSFDI